MCQLRGVSGALGCKENYKKIQDTGYSNRDEGGQGWGQGPSCCRVTVGKTLGTGQGQGTCGDKDGDRAGDKAPSQVTMGTEMGTGHLWGQREWYGHGTCLGDTGDRNGDRATTRTGREMGTGKGTGHLGRGQSQGQG